MEKKWAELFLKIVLDTSESMEQFFIVPQGLQV